MNTNTKARRGRARRISSIWLVPAVALAIGVWMAYDTVTSRGALISIEMSNAEGVEAGQTMVRVKDVAVGRVESIRLSDDFSRAEASVRMFEGTDPMLNMATKVWVVKPRIGREGISGLGTLLSGAYIEMRPGDSNVAQRHFEALPQPPVLRGDEQGIRVRLSSFEGSGVSAGDPVNYRGYTVGRVASADFDIENQMNVFTVFVEDPFASLVTENVRFWQSSGVRVAFGADGFKLDIGSLESLIAGGITFDVLDNNATGESVEQDHEFQLFADKDTAQQEGFTHYAEYLMLIEESVRGLSPGAPVEFRGIRVGTVMQVPYTGDGGLGSSLMNMRVPILVRFEPERLGPQYAGFEIASWQEQLEALFGDGLRASLRSGNLLTGALYVDLNFHEETPYVANADSADYPIFPVVRGSGSQIDQKVADLLDNLNQIDFGQFAATAEQTLQSSEETLAVISALGARLEVMLADPEMQALPAQLRQTLSELQQVAEGYSADSPAYQDFERSMERLNMILRDLEPFAESLRDKPNSLLFNIKTELDPQPRSHQ
ncbi:intermembrane transport protein PqiB [Aliidiomarina sp. Khilg15.8]